MTLIRLWNGGWANEADRRGGGEQWIWKYTESWGGASSCDIVNFEILLPPVLWGREVSKPIFMLVCLSFDSTYMNRPSRISHCFESFHFFVKISSSSSFIFVEKKTIARSRKQFYGLRRVELIPKSMSQVLFLYSDVKREKRSLLFVLLPWQPP